MDDLVGQVREVIAAAFDLSVEAVPETASQVRLSQWSSLNHMLLLSTLEDQFGVQFSMGEMVKMTSVEAIVQTLLRHGVLATVR